MKRAIFLVLAFYLSIISNGQLGIVKERITSSNGKVKIFVFDTIKNVPKLIDSVSLIKRYFNLSAEDKLVHVSNILDPSGIEHIRFQQFHSGIKVENAEIIVNSKTGNILSINGEAGIIDKVSLKPRINSENALKIAKQSLNVKTFAWESPQMESLIKNAKKDEKATYKPNPELVLFGENDSSRYCLAYKINIATYDPYGSYVFYIHAQTGEIIKFFDKEISGSAITRYSGTVNLATRYDPATGTYVLQNFCSPEGRFIETKDCNNSLPANSVPFSDQNDVWDEWHNSAMDDAALDAQYGATKTYDYFKNIYHRNSYDNSYGSVFVYVHYYDQNLGLSNAKWDLDINAICCADGDSVNNYQPHTSEEIIAHEFGHGMLRSFSSINYSGETGALDEGLADIWGACVEEYANLPGNDMWIFGEDVITTPYLRRNFAAPYLSLYQYIDAYGLELEHYPDTYHGVGWYTGGINTYYVHFNSTVISHWFYILSIGESGVNDNQSEYIVSPIGTAKASNIVYETLSQFTYNIDFSTFRQLTINAAIALYGSSSDEVIQLKNAWYAVGLGNEVPNLISGAENICLLGTDYTFSLPEEFAGETITWNVTGNPYIVSGQGTREVTLRSNNTGSATISATYNHGNGNIVCQKSVWVGTHDVEVWAEGGDGGYAGNAFPFYITPFYEGDNIDWSVSPYGEVTDLGNGYASIYFDSPNYYTIWARNYNECGYGNPAYVYFNVIEGGFLLSPNPASDQITITVKKDKSINVTSDKIYEVSILDIYGTLKSKNTSSGESFVIPIHNLTDGTYIVKINEGKTFVTKKLIIKH